VSIWASTISVGYDDNPDDPNAGVVLRYTESHRYPEIADGPASVDLAVIPDHCVPGHDDAAGWLTGPWLRLGMVGWSGIFPEALADVVLDPEAARALGQWLVAWADDDHVQPEVRA
jgi:hypothetical protein